MGNCVSFQFSCDQTLNHILRWLCGKGYIRNIKKNLKALQREMEDLSAIQDEVKNKVAREEKQHRERLKAVQVWLTRVESINTHVNNLLSTSYVQLQKLCLYNLCSKNVCGSYTYGKSVFLLLEEVKKLKLEGDFDVVAELTPISEVEERPIWPTVGHETMFEKIWNRIMEDGVGIMGLHGMGGVGKTTLFKKIHNKFIEMPDRFNIVIWIVVSQGAENSKIQQDIAEKLHLCGDRWPKKSESDKAEEIHRVLKRKKFVLMLDDLWEKLDLATIGIPFPTIENGCKVTFTTRSLLVCGQMGDHEPIQVKCLDQNEAWEFFKTKVGENTLGRNTVILERAKQVAKKCCGLPLALSVIGDTMTCKTTVQEWDEALRKLTKSATRFLEMKNNILPILKFSYDNLDEDTKKCFLYCALFPEDYSIDKARLIDYWICEGFIGKCKDIRKSRNKGYEVLGTLIRANLLIEAYNELVKMHDVKMHDVVREMALWIASCFGRHKKNFFVKAGVGLFEIPNVKDWGNVRRMSLMNNKIEEITCNIKCYELTTMFLQNNNLKNLSGESIMSMQKVVVLDLSNNHEISELPEQISELARLQYLDLSGTSIEQLPICFRELKKLTQLNLTSTYNLRSISGISKLSNLRILKLLYSKVHGDDSLVKELQLLEHLQVLTLTISAVLGLELISANQRLVKCIDFLQVCKFQVNLSLLMRMENLRCLVVESCHILEMKYRESEANTSRLDTFPCFSNLSDVDIYDCDSSKDLTWLLLAPNLVNLSIHSSEVVEEIINKEKANNLTCMTPFQSLETLSLICLSKLKTIYWNPLQFPFLRWIEVESCPELRKLPFNATSVSRVEEFSIAMDPREQETELEWEDENTKQRFLHSFDLAWLLNNF